MLASLPCSAQTFDWLESTGPEGGWVTTLAEAPGGDFYAGTLSVGGVFRSTDQGATWQEVGLRGENVSEIIINNAGTVFAALSTREVRRSLDNGASWPVSGSDLVGTYGSLAYDPTLDILYAAKSGSLSRSVDGGDTWQAVSANFPSVQVKALTAVPNGGPLFVGTDSNYAFRSVDGGITWDLFDSGMTLRSVEDFLIVPEGNIYAATWGGWIYRAAWDGTTWTRLSNGLDDSFCLTVNRDATGHLWAGTYSSGTYFSCDDGENWTPYRVGIEMQGVRDLLFFGTYDFLAGCNGGGIFRSVNGGVSWTPSSVGMNRSDVRTILLTGSGTLFAATFGAGVHRSVDDGVTWTPINNGIEDQDMYDIVSHPNGDLFAGTWGTHIYRSQDGGHYWYRTGTTPNITRVSCLAIKPSSGDLFAGGLYGGGVWRSTDKGDTWTPASGGLTVLEMEDLVVEADGDLLAATNGGGIFRSEDNGGFWAPLNNGLTDLNVNQVLSLPGGVLFAALPNAGLFRSLDDGGTWNLVDASLAESSMQSIAVNPNDFLFASARSNGHIYQSNDGGDSWSLISGWYHNVHIETLAFDQDGRLLAGTGGLGVIYTDQSTPVFLHDFMAERSAPGAVTVRWSVSHDIPLLTGEVFRSVDGSAREQLSFGRLAGGPAFEFIDAAAPAEPCDYWLRLTDADGVHSWYGPVSVDKAGPFTARLSIEAVWPNPATHSTTIRFSVPMNETARLDVYDLRGRLVRRLRQDIGGSGTLETVWDARDDSGARVASGTYFLRLSSENRVVTEKAIVLGHQR